MMQATVSRLVLIFLGVLFWPGNSHAVPCQNNLPPSNPDDTYINHGDGTVTDMRTGLMWQRCAEGLSGVSCQTGSAQIFTWTLALGRAEASTLADYTDWRLPNVRELSSLVEDCRVWPSINTNLFPNTPRSFFWSGSPYAGLSNNTWGVSFDSGHPYPFLRNTGLHVRLVRGGQ